MRQPGEPSVEEILESIKQVMARDARGPSRSDAAAPDGDDAGAPDDVLDLTRMRQVPPVAPSPAPLVTDAAAGTMRGAFDTLAAHAAPAAPRAAALDAAPLEAMVRELLRPALAAWLDRNLPPLVERMVAAEIARIVGEAR